MGFIGLFMDNHGYNSYNLYIYIYILFMIYDLYYAQFIMEGYNWMDVGILICGYYDIYYIIWLWYDMTVTDMIKRLYINKVYINKCLDPLFVPKKRIVPIHSYWGLETACSEVLGGPRWM